MGLSAGDIIKIGYNGYKAGKTTKSTQKYVKERDIELQNLGYNDETTRIKMIYFELGYNEVAGTMYKAGIDLACGQVGSKIGAFGGSFLDPIIGPAGTFWGSLLGGLAGKPICDTAVDKALQPKIIQPLVKNFSEQLFKGNKNPENQPIDLNKLKLQINNSNKFIQPTGKSGGSNTQIPDDIALEMLAEKMKSQLKNDKLDLELLAEEMKGKSKTESQDEEEVKNWGKNQEDPFTTDDQRLEELSNDPSVNKDLYDPVVQDFMKNYPNRKGVFASYEQYINNSNKPKSQKLPPVASQPFNREAPFRTPNAEAISKTLYAANTYIPPYSSTLNTSNQGYYKEEDSYYYDKDKNTLVSSTKRTWVPTSQSNSGDSPIGELIGSLLTKLFKAIFHGW